MADRPITVAVAANFVAPMEGVVTRWAQMGRDPVRVVWGSTGKLYAQIVAGAPFDLFLAADQDRPARLWEQGLGQGAPTPYAIGRLALVGAPDLPALAQGTGRIAIADPVVAPYGRAAVEVLTATDVLPAATLRLVLGESIGQAATFVRTGNAPAGLLALSLVLDQEPGTYHIVPSDLHAPIQQDLIVLTPRGQDLADWLLSEAVAPILRQHGYEGPG